MALAGRIRSRTLRKVSAAFRGDGELSARGLASGKNRPFVSRAGKLSLCVRFLPQVSAAEVFYGLINCSYIEL